MRKRVFFIVAAIIIGFGLIAGARFLHARYKGPKIGVIIYVDHPVLNTVVESFRQEMSTLGYRDGQTATLLFANAQGNHADIEPLIRSLLRQDPTVLVPVSTPVSRVAFNISPKTQQIVYSFVTNPDDLEPALSEHQGTGASDRINYKRSFQLVRDLLPTARLVGLLYNPTERNSEVALQELRSIGPGFDLELVLETISGPAEIREASRRLVPKVDCIFIGPDNTVVGSAATVIETALEASKPVIAVDSGTVEAGALAAYSVEYTDVGRETARLVDRLLRNPGSVRERVVPIYNDKLILNFCTAERLQYKFSDALLGNAARIVRCSRGQQ